MGTKSQMSNKKSKIVLLQEQIAVEKNPMKLKKIIELINIIIKYGK